jgi:nucleoside phosphorylase
MYKSFSADEYRKFLGLPENYHVDGMLCYGSWDKEKQMSILREVIGALGQSFSFGRLPNFLQKVAELSVGGKKFWFDVSYGGALLSEYLHLASLFGSQKNILLGTCGGLSPKISSLDIIIPTLSYGNESATRMYNPQVKDNKHFSDPALSAALNKRVGSLYKTWQGETTTCQAMLAETLEDVQRWSKEGFLGVEMEAATVFAVSKHFNVPSAAVLIVGDNLIQGETVNSESYTINKSKKDEIRAVQYRAALEELLV